MENALHMKFMIFQKENDLHGGTGKCPSYDSSNVLKPRTQRLSSDVRVYFGWRTHYQTVWRQEI